MYLKRNASKKANPWLPQLTTSLDANYVQTHGSRGMWGKCWGSGGESLEFYAVLIL